MTQTTLRRVSYLHQLTMTQCWYSELTIVDDNGGSNSAITAVKVIKNQELPSITRNITDTSSSEPEDKSIKTEDVTNSTRR